MIGGRFDRSITKAVFFTHNTDFKCVGYLISQRLALGPALCLFELEPPNYNGYRVSNDDVFNPRRQIEEPRPGRFKPYSFILYLVVIRASSRTRTLDKYLIYQPFKILVRDAL